MKHFRKSILIVTVVVIIITALEVTSYFGFWIGTGKRFSFGQLTQEKTRHVATAVSLRSHQSLKEVEATSLLAPHPYVGFVYHPDYHPEETKASTGVPVSNWGFLDDKPPLHDRSDAYVVIGIFGGSVAFWLSVQGIDPLLAELAKVPEFNGKRFVVVRTALGGFKQPQQLMTLNYLLALGGYFDIVLNVDGLNEVALAPTWVRSNGMSPHFPRDWANLTSQAADLEMLRRLGALNLATELRGDWASLFLRSGLRHSITLNTVWKLLDGLLEEKITQAQFRVNVYTSSASNKAISYGGRGPTLEYQNADSMYADLVAVWKRSSWQMHTLTQGKKSHYYHVLQPNQYLEGSKRLTPLERKVAVHPGSNFDHGVKQGYPLLRRAGKELMASDVKFIDLTMIFQNVSDQLYIDTCCHFNLTGNQILGKRIGELIRADITKPTPVH